MRYEIRVSHIREDYTISDEHSEVWTRTVEDLEDLKLMLNRIAIATTQFPVVEFPEIRISWDSHHVHIRAIKGKLYYTELKSNNRKDLVVTPDEALRLLEGQPLEQALRRDEEEDAYVRPRAGSGFGTIRLKKILLALSLLLIAGSSFYIWKSLSQQVQLVKAPHFVHTMEEEGELFRKYADVYVNELREGSTVFEVSKSGILSIYEMWYSPAGKVFNLIPAGEYRLSAGLHRGQPAFLAGEYHLLELHDDKIMLHGMPFERYGKKLTSIGKILKGGFQSRM
ncbi:MAG TPA: hypothetical protein VJ952_05020 [Opitutales bacterium]|nr:hypothetical protein [Opitutales bacterium]